MIRLKIQRHDEEHIELVGLHGLERHGFGTFLNNLKPEEIECDKFSKRTMLKAKEKGGLNGCEIWADNRIAWGDPASSIIMPIDEISKMDGADSWLSEIKEV